MNNNTVLSFYGGKNIALIPIVIFLIFCSLFFTVFRVFDMTALAMCAFIALMCGSVFAKNYSQYWRAVIVEGIGSQMAITIATILLIIGMFAKMVAKSGVAEGFAWIADSAGLHGGAFVLFTFIAVCAISTATGTSIGTLFTAFPVFYASGILVGADPVVLASAILSGAIFGDNIAPISDTTIASASTQSYKNKDGTAEISGVVTSRFRFAALSGIIAGLLFFLFGSGSDEQLMALQQTEHHYEMRALVMLIPVAILLTVAIKTRDIFKAIPSGILSGIIIGLISGVFEIRDIFAVENGHVSGFLFEGFSGMVSTILFVISLFGIMGILKASNTMNRISDYICNCRLAKTTRGAEGCIASGIILATAFVGGVTSASILTFGPVASEIGQKKNLHPFRRAVLVDCFSMTIAAIIPFLSAFIFIVTSIISSLRIEYPFIPEINPINITLTSFYSISLFFVMCFSVAVGWGRRYEGKNGEPVKKE